MPHGFATPPVSTEAPPQDVPQAASGGAIKINPAGFKRKKKARTKFNASVPGESLTGEPGGKPYEQPPQFADPKEALEFIWDNMNKKSNVLPMVALLDKGIPVEALAQTLLFSGFAAGKWTPDAAVLMLDSVVGMVMTISKQAGIKPMTKKKMGKKTSSEKRVESIINMESKEANRLAQGGLE